MLFRSHTHAVTVARTRSYMRGASSAASGTTPTARSSSTSDPPPPSLLPPSPPLSDASALAAARRRFVDPPPRSITAASRDTRGKAFPWRSRAPAAAAMLQILVPRARVHPRYPLAFSLAHVHVHLRSTQIFDTGASAHGRLFDDSLAPRLGVAASEFMSARAISRAKHVTRESAHECPPAAAAAMTTGGTNAARVGVLAYSSDRCAGAGASVQRSARTPRLG